MSPMKGCIFALSPFCWRFRITLRESDKISDLDHAFSLIKSKASEIAAASAEKMEDDGWIFFEIWVIGFSMNIPYPHPLLDLEPSVYINIWSL